MHDWTRIPADLPVPQDDGAADHLPGLADALDLPTFHAGGSRLYKRLTLVIRDGRIEHVFYPIFPPDQHAQQVLRWLHTDPVG